MANTKRAKPLSRRAKASSLVRHLPAVLNRMLSLHSRDPPLRSSSQTRKVMASFGGIRSCFRKGSDRYLSRATQGKNVLEKRRNELAKELNNYKSKGRVQGRGPNDIALALFNMKEFIYLKQYHETHSQQTRHAYQVLIWVWAFGPARNARV